MNFRYIFDLSKYVINKLWLKVNRIKIGKNSKIRGFIRFTHYGNISIGDNCRINSGNKYNPIGFDNYCNIIAEKTGEIIIGNYFGMSNSTLYSRKSIRIGNNVLIGNGTKIYDTDFHSLNYKFRGTIEDKKNTENKSIIIEDNVFIGAGCIILKGIHIGRNSIIGAGSVVTKDIPTNEIWAGNPAKFIKKIPSI
jgi:acetyltransferase-like isoleucine patch superfamily enzyme